MQVKQRISMSLYLVVEYLVNSIMQSSLTLLIFFPTYNKIKGVFISIFVVVIVAFLLLQSKAKLYTHCSVHTPKKAHSMNDIEQNIKVLFFLFYEIQTFKEENTSGHIIPTLKRWCIHTKCLEEILTALKRFGSK